MDRIDIYIQLVSEKPVLLVPFILVIVLFAFIPADKKLFVTLVLMVPWLVVARSPGLGPIAAAAKLSSGLSFLLVTVSAMMHPGPKRELPSVVWLFVVVAALSIFYVLTTDDRMRALVLRSQWVCVTLAGVYTARTIVSYSDLRRIVDAITWGCIFSLAVPLSGLLLFPVESFLKGQGRFQPWGANSNQIGMMFALAAPLLAYSVMSVKKVSLKPFLLSMLIITLGMAMMTGSRQTLLAIGLVMIPILFALSKRPVFTMVVIIIGAIGLNWILSVGESAQFDRLSTLQSGRMEIWSRYWSDVFLDRPLVGLLGSSGQSSEKAVYEVGMHPHNAWFYYMYLGGASLAVPMAYLAIYSSYCGIKVWKFRNQLPGDPLLYNILVMLLLAMYVQGLFNQVVYWPTYSWSYLHVALATIFICIWRDIHSGNLDNALYDSANLYEDIDQEVDDLEEFEDYGEVAQRPTA